MIEVSVTINRWKEIERVKAVRINPVKIYPKKGDICTYSISYIGEDLGEVEHQYGDALGLSIKMLKLARGAEIGNQKKTRESN